MKLQWSWLSCEKLPSHSAETLLPSILSYEGIRKHDHRFLASACRTWSLFSWIYTSPLKFFLGIHTTISRLFIFIIDGKSFLHKLIFSSKSQEERHLSLSYTLMPTPQSSHKWWLCWHRLSGSWLCWGTLHGYVAQWSLSIHSFCWLNIRHNSHYIPSLNY